ncbi:uncharacterized protein LOC131668303 isoform X2 [Phymastichus coffea]|uniref:uncharacterized protein LOC131668303 isoform X2 n=1 Tax=Phymastichus coffea TaxID=108790 RepID=UPI00273B20B9|nr:uncharacterized protein LOC131668303 isoform X2 [Phymastichus coffea]
MSLRTARFTQLESKYVSRLARAVGCSSHAQRLNCLIHEVPLARARPSLSLARRGQLSRFSTRKHGAATAEEARPRQADHCRLSLLGHEHFGSLSLPPVSRRQLGDSCCTYDKGIEAAAQLLSRATLRRSNELLLLLLLRSQRQHEEREAEAAECSTSVARLESDGGAKRPSNLAPVSRLLRRRHRATSLATKSCDNIYTVNKTNGFFEWKHGRSGHDEQDRQSSSLDWRLPRRADKNSSHLERRKASRSAEQLSRSNALQTTSTKSKIVSLLKRLSPRLPRPNRPNSKTSLPSSPNVCPWVQVEYSNGDGADGTRSGEQPQRSTQEPDYSFQRELQLNEMHKRAIKASNSRQELANDAAPVFKENRSVQPCPQPNVHVQEKQDKSDPNIRAVHEDRGSSQEWREVAGAGEPGPLPRTSRRSRPHSLAVQPLNYQRLDPDEQQQQQQQQQQQLPVQKRAAVQTSTHPNMTSQESIGSCSLDVERSASDRSDPNAGSPSEKTLHSLNLECNGDEEATQAGAKQPRPRIEVTRPAEPEDRQSSASPVSNGRQSRKLAGAGSAAREEANGTGTGSDREQLTGKKPPSYLGLACSINGYTGITRYDSKLREGFRSRDSSPGARLLARDTSPAGFRSSEAVDASPSSLPPKSQSISPLAMDRNRHSNGFAKCLQGKCKIDGHLETTSGGSGGSGGSDDSIGCDSGDRRRTLGGSSACQDYSEDSVNRAASPVFAVEGRSPPKKDSAIYSYMSPCTVRRMLLGIGVPGLSPVQHQHHLSHEAKIRNGVLPITFSTEKSFIQQRIERIYGPCALAQGFYFQRPAYNKWPPEKTERPFQPFKHNNTSAVDDSSTEQSLKNLPVLRHLKPEFRAQLPVVSPRRPTNGGTEQIIEPLKRMSISSAKNDTKETETKSSAGKMEDDATTDSKVTDQQLAAPKVVLPVIEPVSSDSSTNIPKQGVEPPPNETKDKVGRYFLNLLNKERDRLIVLAEQAEAELEHSGAVALPEEASGKLRSAAGKARLLATQKMKQFEGLCQKNINQLPGEEFPTTSEDLAGFWDMVMLQVVQVNHLFELIERSRNSQWQEIVPEQKSAPTTPQNGSASKRRQTPSSKAKSAANSEAARKTREVREQTRRQMLEEKRRAMRSNANKSDDSVEIFVPDT